MNLPRLLCKIFGHKIIDKKIAFHSDNPDYKKDWSTHQAKCERCKCNLIALQQFGEYSQQQVMSKFIEVQS